MKKLIYLLAIMLFFTQCTKDNNYEEYTISGAAVKGKVVDATVTVYEYEGNGSRGTELSKTITTQDGEFNVVIKFPGVVEVVVTGGTYVDEATRTTTSLNSSELRTIVPASGSHAVAVTALTTIASAYIDEHANLGLSKAIAKAEEVVSNAFGIGNVDIFTTIPADLSEVTSANASQKALQYGAVQAGLSQIMSMKNLDPSVLPAFIQEMADDFRDGVFDGKNGTLALEFATEITPAEAASGLNKAIENFLNGTNNRSNKAPNAIF
jgi:hypothetical protein